MLNDSDSERTHKQTTVERSDKLSSDSFIQLSVQFIRAGVEAV